MLQQISVCTLTSNKVSELSGTDTLSIISAGVMKSALNFLLTIITTQYSRPPVDGVINRLSTGTLLMKEMVILLDLPSFY